YLSGVPVVKSLKKQLYGIRNHNIIRKCLVGVQFVTAAFVMIGSFIITKKVDFFFSKQLGFNKEYVLTVQSPRNWTPEGVRQSLDARNTLRQLPFILNASLSYDLPSKSPGASVTVFKPGTDSSRTSPSQLIMCDNLFAHTYGIELLAGTFFSEREDLQTPDKIVINEAHVSMQGWASNSDAIGKQMRIAGFSDPFTISGVVKNFHLGSMQEAIKPQTFLPVLYTNTYRYFSLKLKPGNASNHIVALEEAWKTKFPCVPFEFQFLDDSLKNLYQAELQLKKASITALLLSSILVMLGIIGLVSISLQKRTREIGIRRVLGANVFSLIRLFVKEFLSIAIIGSLIAIPISWLVLRKWLNEYAYRIELNLYPFLLCIFLLVFCTSLLISWLTYRFSQINPSRNINSD
ncbi:MAG: ABC transporter permease, partial [Flavihumibacter sp.]|nr:ABC transporter permease [Flavihumibacter sp.]